MINYNKVSLTKMLNVVFIVMLIPFITLSFWLYNNNRNEIKNTINETMTQFVSNVSFMYIKPHVERINNEFMFLKNDKSTSVNLMDLNDHNNEFIKAAISSFNRTPHFSGVIISNNKKDFIILPEINLTEYDVEERPWFPHYGKDGEVVYSNAYTSSYSEYRGDNRMIITAAMNVFNSNKRKIGTVAYDLDMNYLSEKLKYMTLPFNSHLKVTDKKGMYIINDSINKNMTSRVPAEWVEAADNKQGRFYDKKSRNHIFYYTYPNPEWVVFAVISEKDYNREVGKMDAGFLVALLSSSLYYLFFAILCHFVCYNILMKIKIKLHGYDLNKVGDGGGLLSVFSKIDNNNNALQQSKIKEITDSLTGLKNRRGLEQAFSENINNKKKIHLAIIDIDNFKGINDNYGHTFGDSVLSYLGKTGIDICNEKTDVFRYGGEEFVVLFIDNTTTECMDTMNKWLMRVSRRRWREQDLTLTFSGGLAERKDEDLSSLIEKADSALYQAKNMGKKRIIKHS